MSDRTVGGYYDEHGVFHPYPSGEYSITSGGDYTGGGAAPPPPTYSGTPGTGAGIPNAYNPAQVAAGEQAAYETLLANGLIPSVAVESPPPAAPSTAVAPGNPAPVVSYDTDPYTGQATYDASYSTDGGSTWGSGFGDGTVPPGFGAGRETNPARQQPVVAGQFDPFAWSGTANPMGMFGNPNEMRKMILGAMELGAEIQQQQTEPPRFDARQYALHRLGLTEPEAEAPPVPTLPQRPPFGR